MDIMLGIVKADVMKSLEIMGYGVLAIFIVITVLIFIVQLMHLIEVKSEENKLEEGYKPFGEKVKDKLAALQLKEKCASFKAKFARKDKSGSSDVPPQE